MIHQQTVSPTATLLVAAQQTSPGCKDSSLCSCLCFLCKYSSFSCLCFFGHFLKTIDGSFSPSWLCFTIHPLPSSAVYLIMFHKLCFVSVNRFSCVCSLSAQRRFGQCCSNSLIKVFSSRVDLFSLLLSFVSYYQLCRLPALLSFILTVWLVSLS